MAAVSLADVDQRQHHENKGLQQNNQHMEKPPNQTGDDLTKSCTGSSESSEIKSEATKKRNKEEHQFASIHIAEQSHTERNKLCKVLDDVHRKIERPQKRELADRCSKELNDKTRKALDLDAVVEKKK